MPAISRDFRHITALATAFIAGAIATVTSAFAAGPTLGQAIGGLFAVVLIFPPMITGAVGWRKRIELILALVSGVALAWAIFLGPATFAQKAQLIALALALAWLLAAMLSALEAIHIPPLIVAATVTLIGFAWLTWPIWLSPAMEDSYISPLVARIVPIQPILVSNGVLTFTSPWTEQAIAYQWTVLDQDIPLRLPTNALLCIGFESLSGAILFAISALFCRFYRNPELIELPAPARSPAGSTVQ